MLQMLAARALTRPASPTVDLYFLNACGDLVAPGGPVRRLAPTAFASHDVRLVIRHDTGAPPMRRDERLVYLLDDAVFAGARDPALPVTFRAKLRAVDCAAARRLLPLADAVVTSTPGVAADLPHALMRPGVETATVDPFWSEPLPDLEHFAAPGPARVLFLGAGTHGAALGFVVEVLRRARALGATLTLLASANHRRRLGSAGLPVDFVAATDWPGYRRAIRDLRGHVALYPLSAGAFARARSANKLIEHAVVGAAPLYAEGWAPGAAAVEQGAGLALPPDPEAWAQAVAALAGDRARARSLAQGAQALARGVNRPEPQRALWARLLRFAG
jgi:hypothetical protein